MRFRTCFSSQCTSNHVLLSKTRESPCGSYRIYPSLHGGSRYLGILCPANRKRKNRPCYRGCKTRHQLRCNSYTWIPEMETQKSIKLIVGSAGLTHYFFNNMSRSSQFLILLPKCRIPHIRFSRSHCIGHILR
jgi:hypothetical protein